MGILVIMRCRQSMVSLYRRERSLLGREVGEDIVEIVVTESAIEDT